MHYATSSSPAKTCSCISVNASASKATICKIGRKKIMFLGDKKFQSRWYWKSTVKVQSTNFAKTVIWILNVNVIIFLKKLPHLHQQSLKIH